MPGEVLTWSEVPGRADWARARAEGLGEPPGVYTPNVAPEFLGTWRAKLVGHRSGTPQVEVRTTKGSTQLLLMVSADGVVISGRSVRPGCQVRISLNGPLELTGDEWDQFTESVAEAFSALNRLRAAGVGGARPEPVAPVPDTITLPRRARCIAWTRDGQQLVAAGEDAETCLRRATEAGFTDVVLNFAPVVR